jgi:hypothetical protein
VVVSLAELERSEAARVEQASAAVQYAYDLQDEAEAATIRADDHAAAIMMAALTTRAAAGGAQEEETAIGEDSPTVELPVDETPVVEADQVENEEMGVVAGASEMVRQEATETELEETAVEEPVQVEEEAAPAKPPWPEDTSTWQGEYFNNMTLEGEPVMVREDAEIDFDWGTGSPAPAIDDDGFSVRWTRTANLRPGLYRFTVTSDDGARLWVNERLVISAWYDHTEMTFRREMELPGGPVELRLEYYEKSMLAMIRVSWEKIG